MNKLVVLGFALWSFKAMAFCQNNNISLPQTEINSLQPVISELTQIREDHSLAIEDDTLWQSMLAGIRSGYTDLMFIDGRGLHIKLTLIDLQDQVYRLLDKKNYAAELEMLQKSDGDFLRWYEVLQGLAAKDKKLKSQLDHNLLVGLYDHKGVALLHPIGLLTSMRGEKIARNKDIQKYNKLALDPESISLLSSINIPAPAPFQKNTLTVAKIDQVPSKAIKASRAQYYSRYCLELEAAEAREERPVEFECDPLRKHPVSISRSSFESKEDKNDTVTLFNAIHNHPDKALILAFLKQEIGLDQMLTPSFVQKNQDDIEEALQEYTYHKLLSQEDDQTVLKLRQWVGNNHALILEKIATYNQLHADAPLSFEIKNPKLRVRRMEVLSQYETLMSLFPAAPWIDGQAFTLVDGKGNPVLTGKDRLGKLAWKTGQIIKGMLAPEKIVAYGVGASILLGTGNFMLASASKTIIHDAIRGYRYDKSLKDTFKSTPVDVFFSLTSASGFTAGKIPYMMFVGALHGGVRSTLTGQDLKTGMMVGAASELIRSTLPRDLAHPTIGLEPGQMIDASYAAKSIALEAGFNTVYHGTQGATVAAFSGDKIGVGALKGGLYGVGETALMVGLFGIQYDVHGLIGEEELKRQFSLEADYTKEVETFGIDLERHRDLAADTFEASEIVDFRLAYGKTGQWVQKMLGNEASFSAPGFVTSPMSHYASGGTIAHEVGQHQMQYWDMGGANFLITYGKISSKNGTHGSHENGFDVMESDPGRDVNVMEQYRGHD